MVRCDGVRRVPYIAARARWLAADASSGLILIRHTSLLPYKSTYCILRLPLRAHRGVNTCQTAMVISMHNLHNLYKLHLFNDRVPSPLYQIPNIDQMHYHPMSILVLSMPQVSISATDMECCVRKNSLIDPLSKNSVHFLQQRCFVPSIC